MKPGLRTFLVTGAVVLTGAALARALLAERVAEPPFELVRHLPIFEVRRYAPLVLAETTVEGAWHDAGNEGFRRLAGFIFGGNEARGAQLAGAPGEKLAMTAPVGARLPMTAPVGARGAGQSWVISFVMPAGRTLEDLPTPRDPRVSLRAVPARLVAALRFSGRGSEEDFQRREAELRAKLAPQGLEPIGAAEFARYDPPWTLPFLRRNEVLIAVR